jgi:hypothetical protein
MRLRPLGALAVAAGLVMGGCSKTEEPAPAPEAPRAAAPAQQPEMPPSHPPVGEQQGQPGPMPGVPTKKEVVLSDEVRDAWKAVVLEVSDKAENTAQDVSVDIGQTVTVGGLEITVDSFLPAFSMSSGEFTSMSNETLNPAARIIVSENGEQIFDSFIFSMHPTVHPFAHEKYGILLKDFVKK